MNIFFFFNIFLCIFFLPVDSLLSRNTLKCSYNSGIELGIVTFGTGILMDNTISKKSLLKLKNSTEELYKEGMRKTATNLLAVGPTYHYIIDNYLIHDHQNIPIVSETFAIVFIHSLGYYLSHRLMHRNDLFRKYHNFHHRFNETLIPSIANSVSTREFTFAYMIPFIIGELLVKPNINSFNLGVMIVSIMNLIIHTEELNNIQYPDFLVSPEIHLNHHKGKNKRKSYSAPTFNLEYIYSKLIKKKSEK